MSDRFIVKLPGVTDYLELELSIVKMSNKGMQIEWHVDPDEGILVILKSPSAFHKVSRILLQSKLTSEFPDCLFTDIVVGGSNDQQH